MKYAGRWSYRFYLPPQSLAKTLMRWYMGLAVPNIHTT